MAVANYTTELHYPTVFCDDYILNVTLVIQICLQHIILLLYDKSIQSTCSMSKDHFIYFGGIFL